MGFEQAEISAKLFGWNGTREREVGVDQATRALNFIDYAHHEVHAGSHYFISRSVADLGAATDDIMSFSFTTPNTAKWLHMVVSAVSAAGARFRFIETKTGGGGAGSGDLTVFNSNRNSANTSAIISTAATPVAGKVSYDSALFTGGVSLIDVIIGATGVGNAVVGGEKRADNEIILKQNTEYQVSLYNTANVPGSLSLSWYEHTDKEA